MACCSATSETPLARYANSLAALNDDELPLLFPMYTVPLDALMEMSKVEAHEDLMSKGLLVRFQRHMGKAAFVSHQWITPEHPDPECKQMKVLQDALKNMRNAKQIPLDMISEVVDPHARPLATSQIFSEPLFFWYDYFSCPQKQSQVLLQEGPTHLQEAINSISAYVDQSSFFFALMPVLENPSTTNLVSPLTWRGRGWCRLERTCRELAEDHRWILVKSSSDHVLITSAQASALTGNGPVDEGHFTIPEDRLKLEAVLITMVRRKLLRLLKSGDFPGYRSLLNRQSEIFRGLEVDVFQALPEYDQHDLYPETIATFLHQNGFRSIHESDACGWSPLHYAALNGDPSLVQELLDHRADLNKGSQNNHPELGPKGYLPIAVASIWRKNEVLKLLIQAKAKVYGSRLLALPLMSAAAANNVEGVRMLIRAGCSPVQKNLLGQISLFNAVTSAMHEVMDEFLGHADVTPWHATLSLYVAATGFGGAEVVHRLVESRADVNAQTDEMWRASLAMRVVYQAMVWQHRLVKVTACSKMMYHAKGATPLMMALLSGNYECAAALIAAGARFSPKNARGWRAADFVSGATPDFLKEAFEGRNELAGLGKWCSAMVEATEQATQTQEERMVDVRRQTMLIMDIVSTTQDAITSSSESLQSFTHSQFMNNSTANLETNLRQVIMHEMDIVKNSLLGMDGEKDVNLKTAICAMVERLDDGVKRLELASEMGAAGNGATGNVEEMRQELANVAQVLAQQQQEVSMQSMQQVSEILQSELSNFKDTQSVQTVSSFSEQVNQNLARVEASLDKVLEGKAGGESGSRKARAERG